MRYKSLTIIGTSHIAPESLKQVEEIIIKQEPGIIALELDKKRLEGLLSKKREKIRWRDIKRIGIKGFLFSLIGAWVEKKLGEKVGVSPGSEMIEAFRLAKKMNARVALIDQDIETTLKNFSKALTWKEKWHFLVDIIKALIFRKSEISFDLRTVPTQATINTLIKKVKKRYPSIYRVLITDRNKVMSINLAKLVQAFPGISIVAVVGAGHEQEIMKLFRQELSNI